MTIKKISIHIFIFLVMLSCQNNPSSDDESNIVPYSKMSFTTEASIYNGKQYKIGVVLPSDYGLSDEPYPVIYTMDGEELFLELGEILEEQKKRVILIAIYNMGDINRSEDNGYPGIVAYTQFVTKELAPFIEEKYTINPYNRVILGQSWTGVGVTYMAFLESFENRYFQTYISCDGAYIESETSRIHSIAETLKKKYDRFPVSIILRSASHGMWLLGSLFYNQISKYNFIDYKVSFSIVPNSYHGWYIVLPVFLDLIKTYDEVIE